jgi:hypothetical protein
MSDELPGLDRMVDKGELFAQSVCADLRALVPHLTGGRFTGKLLGDVIAQRVTWDNSAVVAVRRHLIARGYIANCGGDLPMFRLTKAGAKFAKEHGETMDEETAEAVAKAGGIRRPDFFQPPKQRKPGSAKARTGSRTRPDDDNDENSS